MLCYSIPFRNACLHVAVQLPYRHFGTVLNNAYNKYSQGTRSGGTAEVFVAIKATKRMEFKGVAQIFSDYVFTPPQHTEPELHVKTVLQHSPEQFIYMFKKNKTKQKKHELAPRSSFQRYLIFFLNQSGISVLRETWVTFSSTSFV